jgi:hypothetical protein
MTPNRSSRPSRGGRRASREVTARPGNSGPTGVGSCTDAARVHRTRAGSVWPVALEQNSADAGSLPGWLLGAIVKIVALYSDLGQRVLLLAPPNDGSTNTPAPRLPRAESGTRLLTGFIEAAQTAARLGRTVHAQLASSPPSPRSDSALTAQSVIGPASSPASSTPTPTEPPTDCPSPLADVHDRYDVVITFVDPLDSAWVVDSQWTDLLTRDGSLAFITHSDCRQGRLVDPASLLARSAQQNGLVPHERVALLEVPIRRSALAASPFHRAATAGIAHHDHTARAHHARVHSDLYLFTRGHRGAGVEEGR